MVYGDVVLCEDRGVDKDLVGYEDVLVYWDVVCEEEVVCEDEEVCEVLKVYGVEVATEDVAAHSLHHHRGSHSN